ncbi:class I SAM-dependent methyltransferase [Thermaurantiacus sp.]
MKAAVLPLLLSAVAAAAQVRPLSTTPAAPDPLALPVLAEIETLLAPAVNAVVPLSGFEQENKERHGDEQYRPEVGQPGKDVIWVPTPDVLVKAMLTAAAVTRDDYVVDLGSGDGRIPIAAARLFGARAHGIDFNPDMVALARRNADRAGVRSRVTFARGDIFESDFSTATVVTLYLLPSLNLKLRPTLLEMKPGTRIVSHAFDMGDWEADETIRTDEATGYLWVVPAKLAGKWAFEVGNERFATQLTQTFQMLAAAGGPIRSGRVRGTRVTFVLAGGRELEGELAADGRLLGRGWTATRVGG